ncbi:MAG TPA: glycoside hydrolase family 97 N-terminal domain-containing protein, partial [Cyclobacteriaceae bacterium]|nr:glycoside hydrolase family 97 N-terminal domain-containing protein [Cyclobacteriaceae bacterium]
MKKLIVVLLLLVSGVRLFAQELTSPDGNLKFSFSLTQAGEPMYQLSYKNKPVIKQSRLGIDIKDQQSLVSGFKLETIETSKKDETWESVWGEVKKIRNNYNELAVTLTQASPKERSMIIRFRLFNDGLGFRYEFPKQPDLQHFIVKDEVTQFAMTGDHKAFWIPGDFDTNEYTYSTTTLTKADKSARVGSADEIATRNPINGAVQTPLMMKSADGLYINIHEAALVNYPAMILTINKSTLALTSTLAPDAVGNKAYLQTPSHTPWRTIIVSDNAADILASKTILNLNEPSVI